MRPKIVFQGISPRPQYLVVAFSLDQGGALRFCEVRVPYAALVNDRFLDRLWSVVQDAERQRFDDEWAGHLF